MYEIFCEISVRCHMIFVLYAEGYMYETYEKLQKRQQRQKMCAGGRKEGREWVHFARGVSIRSIN